MVSKKLISALAVAACCSGACASSAPSGDPTASENTSTQQSADISSFACTPLLTATTPLLTCGAGAAAQLSLATSVQTSIAAQMQAAFANVTLLPQIAQNQVIISSQAAAFTSFFGQQIIAPLSPVGLFNVAIPFSVGTLAPGFTLTANVFGFIPGVLPTVPLPTIDTTLLPAVNQAQFAAFNAATISTMTSFQTQTLASMTMPLTVLITTPLNAALPLTCSGTVPLGCL